MKKFSISTLPKVAKSLERIAPVVAKKIRDKIRDLAEDPRPQGSLKMKGEENAYRFRVADYRVIYEIHDMEVRILVINVGHRREVYKNRG